MTVQPINEELETHQFAYLTTVGRASARPHRIEIWFVVVDGSVWVISGGRDRSDWVRNLFVAPDLDVEIGGQRWSAQARLHPELEDHPARGRLAKRYQDWQPDQPLSSWATNGLLVEIVVNHDG